MTALHYIILSGLVISTLSITGVVLVKSSKRIARFIERNLMTLSAVSAGVFIVTSSVLIRETLELLPLSNALIAFALGIVAYLILHRSFSHHRHGSNHDHGHDHNHRQAAWKILIGDAIHNIADGLLLVTSFAFGPAIGLSNALSIVLHEIPQEISEFVVLKRAGYSNTEAGYRNFATALSIFVGIGLGLALINTEGLQAYLLGATATFFLGIVFTDLFPIKHIIKSKNALQMFAALVIGILVMTSITQALGHSHGHDGVDHHDHDHEVSPHDLEEFEHLHDDNDEIHDDHSHIHS